MDCPDEDGKNSNGGDGLDGRVGVEVEASSAQADASGKDAPELRNSRRSGRSLDEPDTATWSKLRFQVWRVVSNPRFDMGIGMIIFLNIFLMALEADHNASCYPGLCEVEAYVVLNRLLLGIYSVEVALHAFVDRERYFHSRWNVVDFTIVCLGYVDMAIGAMLTTVEVPVRDVVPLLRMMRIARLLRAARLLRIFPVLFNLMRGFLSALQAMFWGFVLIIMLLVLWSVVSVELVHPVNADMVEEMKRQDPSAEINTYCEEAFLTVFGAMALYFQTLVAGDSWGQCTLPLIKYHKATIIIFISALVTVMLGFMNLILAIIVDNASAAREKDAEEKMALKLEEEKAAIKKWKEVIAVLDMDDSGSISLDELMSGYDEVPEVNQTLSTMGIDKQDLKRMFRLMDEDNSGDLDYDEFIDAFLKAQGQDLRIYLMMTKLQCDAVGKSVRRIRQDLVNVGLGTPSPLSQADPKAHGAGHHARHEPTAGAQSDLLTRRERFQPQALEVSLASADVQASRLQAASAAQGAGGMELELLQLNLELQRTQARVQEQFRALQHSIELNMTTVQRHVDLLAAAVPQSELQPGQPAAKAHSGAASQEGSDAAAYGRARMTAVPQAGPEHAKGGSGGPSSRPAARRLPEADDDCVLCEI